jgi:hypothetical protein
MLITTGSGTSARQARLRSSQGARRLARQLVAGQRAPRPRAPRPRAPRRRDARGPSEMHRALRQAAVRQPTARPVAPMVGAEPAACYRVGTLRQLLRRLTRKLARSPLTCLLAAASEVPPNGRAMGIAQRSPDLRSRAPRGMRTLPLTRRPPRCRPVPCGQGRAGRGRTTAGRSRVATERSPMATERSPVAARPCLSRARHGRCQDQFQPGAAPDKRQDPVHRGQQRRGPVRRGSRRRSGLSGLPATAGLSVPAVQLPPRSNVLPPRRQPRRQPQSRPRQSGRRQSGRRQSSLRRRRSAGGTTAKLQDASPPAVGAGIPF